MDHKKVRKLRVEANLTQDFVSTKINMSQNSYSLVESGKSTITLDRMLLLSEILKVRPTELLTKEEIELYNILIGTNDEGIDIESTIHEYQERLKFVEKILQIRDTQIAALKKQITQLNKDAKRYNDLNKF